MMAREAQRTGPRRDQWSGVVAGAMALLLGAAPSLAAQEGATPANESNLTVARDTLTVASSPRVGPRLPSEIALPGRLADSVSAAQALRLAPVFDIRVPTPSPVAAVDGESQEQEAWTDAWGQEKSFGLALFGTLMGNILPWAFNELVPARQELKISQISPRSWGRNIHRGWQWDDNAFQVNFFAHPFQGNIYYNAARSNGFSYWSSLGFATFGSFTWECCGETHLMSLNDWVMTSLGGAAVGEALYRTTSMILDNRATGRERVIREVAAGLLNPERGFTRLVTGNTMKVYDNPEDRADRDPENLELMINSGLRWGNSFRKARGGEIEDDLPLHGFIEADLFYGTLAGLRRQKPFDFFRMGAQFNFIKGRALGELRVRGNLWHNNLSDPQEKVQKLVLMQDFAYNSNPIYERGGTGVSLMYYRELEWGEDNLIEWDVAGSWTLLGGVDALPAKILAEIEGARERFREYDFGIGPGASVGFNWVRKNRQLVSLSYDIRYLETVNGSNGYGFDSHHTTQVLNLRGFVPLPFQNLSLGLDYELFLRNSYYEWQEIGNVNQRAPVFQLFASWNPGRGNWFE
jgi:hypothetical protein